MKNRLVYGTGLVLLIISATLVIWQGSFDFGGYAPSDPGQTFIFWAVSTLIFLLMVTLGFMLVRIGVKLYIERRSNREGSRIKTKLVIGALALSFMPVLFMVLFNYYVLNRNLEKWFMRPVEKERVALVKIAKVLTDEARARAEAQAALLATRPETLSLLTARTPAPGALEPFCQQENVAAAEIVSVSGTVVERCGDAGAVRSTDKNAIVVSRPVKAGDKTVGRVVLVPRIPLDLAQQRAAIESYNSEYARLAGSRQNVRNSSLLLLALITLFILFVATWIALFLARQISVPIAALLHAAREVGEGNLGHRVQVPAIDELAGLVRGFNEMTRELESNSRELDARRRFTEAILESIPTGVISVSSDGRIQRVNRALKQIFPGEQVNHATRLEDLFSREDTSEIRYLMKRARRTGMTSRQMELRSERQTRHLSIIVSALEEKVRSGFVIVLEDTSDLLRAQKAAAWNEVARRIAHEIRNPLTPIALSAERIALQLERAPVSPDVARIVKDCTDTIANEVESVKNLVNEFSQFARFPAAQLVRCDLNEVVESALAVFTGRLDGIELHADLTVGLPPVNVDKEQFKRVIVNLVDNAAEAMQDSPVKRIWIASRAGVADTVELTVADTGCGVTAEDKEKLFLPYFSTKGRGTGLGLAIANHILSEHNAHVRVEDNLPAGTRFIIEIPAAANAGEEPKPVETAAPVTHV
ncbi:MAG: HAMP domain-containing protein [Acidobacteriia bacterium]|nr:HAMP domain-containing protein [Terriglobia bacterium]